MEPTIDRLARKALDHLHKNTDLNSRVIICIAGVPGSGKTTLAAAVCSRINEISPASHATPTPTPIAVAIPMDGFHHPRAHLAALHNAEEALRRRGAAFTFDGAGFLELVRSLRAAGRGDAVVYAPSFDHATKDPVPRSIPIPARARVVLVEGNYCALDRPPWRDAAALADMLWYVDVAAEVAHGRLARRHLASGIVADEKEAWERATGTDELNARDIRENLLAVDEVVQSA
ncbi:P-loop containing nucleoside triphosphate hydrolase protein [Hypoxylon rubiginosum]|uniref:P-loop containing nucleoside triphosphate hydrolase protein n=1 Tax=Hypoxylon rubiginosum TaxID=110542 RepID=A0ACC0CUX4_9PEZI|nr:P-loop containing nucleoside triphosphate hydrolase protein [Hypoxylon rubiginosum]